MHRHATGEVTTLVPVPTSTVAEDVVALSTGAAVTWRTPTQSARTFLLVTFRHLLVERTDAWAAVMTSERGTTRADTRDDVTRGIENVDDARGLAELKGDFSTRIPNGAFNVLHANATTIIRRLENPGVNTISIVGSAPVARHVYAAANEQRVRARDGAQNPTAVPGDQSTSDVEPVIIREHRHRVASAWRARRPTTSRSLVTARHS